MPQIHFMCISDLENIDENGTSNKKEEPEAIKNKINFLYQQVKAKAQKKKGKKGK
jgi:hypothetical protein